MGLLDSLFSGDSGGGILDFLRNNAMNQQFSNGGVPGDQAQYGSPMQANAQMPPSAIQGAPMPPVQPMPQAAPQAAPQAMPQGMPQAQGPGIGDRLLAGFQGLAAPSGGGLLGHLAGAMGGLSGQPTAANLTKQWLLQHTDPVTANAAMSNPEVLKSVIEQLKPKALISTGNGHLYDPNAGKDIKTYDPEDKTPTSVAEYKYYKDNLGKDEAPLSYQQWLTAKEGPGGGLSLNPIYGKDANGNTVLLQAGKNGVAVQSKLPDGVTLNGVDSETLAADAKRLNEGDDTVLKKYSNKGQGRVDLLRLNNEANRQRMEVGQDPIDITQNRVSLQGDIARERAAGNMEGRMAPAAVEAQGAFKIAREASENLSRTNFVPYNKILQMGQAANSNPELKAAATAYNTAVMTYSKAITPTGVGTVTAQEHARQILETADGPAATKAAFDQLSREVDMAHQSPGLARQYFADARKARMDGKPPPPMPSYDTTPSQTNQATPAVKDGDIAHNPQSGETIIRKNGKWVPLS